MFKDQWFCETYALIHKLAVLLTQYVALLRLLIYITVLLVMCGVLDGCLGTN